MVAKKSAPVGSEEPQPKKCKTDQSKSVEDEAEVEKDAPRDKRPTLKEDIIFDAKSTTLNVLPTFGGNVLMALSDGGMQFLLAGARANVGVKAGRYMYEINVVEALNPQEGSGNRGKLPMPRQVLRVGFSLAGSSLILGEDEDGVCFDAEGSYTAEKKKTSGVTEKIGRTQIIAVLLNLDEKSPNYHTISLFRDGKRFCEPRKLPEAFKGKALYPHVCYRNISVHMNFGPAPLQPLPFKCSSLATAAIADVVLQKPSIPKDGRYEVMFPVAFPDEGTFEWLDVFLEKNPQYVELSERKIVEWAAKSGLVKPKSPGGKSSGDKPDFNYGLVAMDDLSVKKVLNSIAPLVPRNYIVMEVKENLTAADRMATLKRFPNSQYKTIARVVMGEPNEEYKKVIQSKILKGKRDKAEREWKAQKAEKERKKQLAARQKQLAEMQKAAAEKRKKAEEERKAKAAELAKKRAEEAAKKKAEEEAKLKEEAGEAGEEDNEKKDAEEDPVAEQKDKMEAIEVEEKKEEEVVVEADDEEAKIEEAEDDDAPPEVELTEEEKNVWFLPPSEKDLTPQVLSRAFGKFTLPKEDEGFDEISYEWQGAEKADDYLRTWVRNKKLTSQMDHLKPSDWFKERHTNFVQTLREWQEKQKLSLHKKQQEKKAAEKKGITEEDTGTDPIDVFAVENVNDAGSGHPLFASFTFEDWALFALRYELVLLAHAFKHDVDDEEYIGVHEPNLAFYYNKYFQKQLVVKHYGKNSNAELIALVKDCVDIDPDKNVLTSSLEDWETLDIYVKLTEECRRERQRRVDAGDETVRLNFTPVLKSLAAKPVQPAYRPPVAAPKTAAAPKTQGRSIVLL